MWRHKLGARKEVNCQKHAALFGWRVIRPKTRTVRGPSSLPEWGMWALHPLVLRWLSLDWPFVTAFWDGCCLPVASAINLVGRVCQRCRLQIRPEVHLFRSQRNTAWSQYSAVCNHFQKMLSNGCHVPMYSTMMLKERTVYKSNAIIAPGVKILYDLSYFYVGSLDFISWIHRPLS